MARDVMRHRLVLSFEALSDNVTPDEILAASCAASPSPSSPSESHDASRAAAPERLLQRLDWHVVRQLDGLLQGEYRSLFRGPGVDLADLREYQPGDDVRYIDWNVTARLTTPYVREYHEDREITAWFLLDLSPSVDFGTVADGRHKRAVLVDFVTTLARVLTRRGNRIGAIVYGGGSSGRSRPRPARRAGAAAGRRPAAPADRTRAPATNLAELLEAGHRTIKRRSFVVIVSDFISAPGWERRCTSWPGGTSCWPCGSSTRASRRCPTWASSLIEDAETGEQLYVDTGDRAFRERFEAAAHGARGVELAGGVPAGRRRRGDALDRRRPRARDRADGHASASAAGRLAA